MSYFLYKIWVKGYGKYYIGVTSNPEQRKSSHFSRINSLVKFFTTSQATTSSGLLKCHYDLACALCDLSAATEVKKHLRFKVLDQRKYVEDILKLERETIIKARAERISNIVHR